MARELSLSGKARLRTTHEGNPGAWEDIGGAFRRGGLQIDRSTALEYGDRSITQGQLAKASRLVFDKLERLQIRRGAHIGVLANDVGLIVPAMVGVLARGCVFALLDPAHPANYLHDLANEAGKTDGARSSPGRFGVSP
jgi:acyl-CoA synthetase (AMP-forming)/AMP-acid ligase II